MRFGIFYELQLPRPWGIGAEERMVRDALLQVELADKLGLDYAWAVEHHFLEEYSHCSASDVFLSAAAARTERIRLGYGIRQVIPNYNHPARTAESVGMLDLVSGGRVEFGIGEGATRLELGGFGIPAREKRALALEAAREISEMMTMEPYPGYEGGSFSMPCRNVLPKPVQKPHPPMWMACTNRETIREAARLGLGALAFSFLDMEEARKWSGIYYDTLKSEECVPLTHVVNPNLALVSAFSLHEDRAEAVRRGQENFEFFGYALTSLVTKDVVPGRSALWESFVRDREEGKERTEEGDFMKASLGIGTPEEFAEHVRSFEECGVDQMIFLQQAGNNKHEHICESLELFSSRVLGEFTEGREEREARRREELAPYVEAALARREGRAAMEEGEIPVVEASVKKVAVT